MLITDWFAPGRGVPKQAPRDAVPPVVPTPRYFIQRRATVHAGDGLITRELFITHVAEAESGRWFQLLGLRKNGHLLELLAQTRLALDGLESVEQQVIEQGRSGYVYPVPYRYIQFQQ